MRQWIDLLEAKKSAVDNKQRAQVLYDRTLNVVTALAKTNFDFRSGWDQSWANMINAGIKEARKSHENMERKEVEYAKQYGETYTPTPFDRASVIADVTSKWWDEIAKPAADQMVSDAKWEYEDYQDGHPRVESSDEMSALQDQLKMSQDIYYKGSDTIEGMNAILDAINGYVNDVHGYVYVDNNFIRSGIDFIHKCMPAILLICQYMGASRQNPV